MRELFVQALKESLKECEEADDAGTVDRVMGDWQEWVKQWPQIFDESGGI